MMFVVFSAYEIFCSLEMDETVFQFHANFSLCQIAADKNEINLASCNVANFKILIIISRKKYAYITSS